MEFHYNRQLPPLSRNFAMSSCLFLLRFALTFSGSFFSSNTGIDSSFTGAGFDAEVDRLLSSTFVEVSGREIGTLDRWLSKNVDRLEATPLWRWHRSTIGLTRT